jgi:hypothetical protein
MKTQMDKLLESTKDLMEKLKTKGRENLKKQGAILFF